MQRRISEPPQAQFTKLDGRRGPVAIDPSLFQQVCGGVTTAPSSYDVSPTGLPKGGWGAVSRLDAPKGGWL
jgi:hypothetical protein